MDVSSNAFLHTFRLPVKPSPIIRQMVVSLHIICLIMAWVNSLPLSVKIILSCIIVVSYYLSIERINLYKSRKDIDKLILNSEDEWQVRFFYGSSQSAVLGNSLFVHPWMTVFSLKFGHQREYFIFTPELLDADTFRRLRVRLRFKVVEQN